MSTIDFNHLSNLIPASLSPESAEELATALSTGRWWAIMEVLHPIDEERQFDFTSDHQSQTVEDEFSASGPAETADASSVTEASGELATALAAGAIMVAERPVEEPQVDISSVPFLEAPETSPGASVPENREPTTSPVLKSQPGAPVYAESDTPGYGNQIPTPAEPALGPPVCPGNGYMFQMVSAEPKDYKRLRRVSRCRRSPTLQQIREAWKQQHVEVVASRGQNRIPEPQPERPQLTDVNEIIRELLSGLEPALPPKAMREPQDEAFVNQMPHQNLQHVEVVASRGQNQIPEPQPEQQQQNEPERPQQRDLVVNRRVRGVLRGLQSARPLRRMREQDEAFVNQMPHQNLQHVEVVASRGQNQIPEPQPEQQQQNEPERPQQRDLVVNGRVRGVLRGLQSARPLRRMRELQDEAFVNQMPHQNLQHVEVVASRGQNQIPEPQPEQQQQNEPERPQQRDLVINGRVRGVLRGLQSARPLRRMREQDEAFVNQMPHQNLQHVEVVASRGQNQIPEPQPEQQQQNEPERPQQRDLVINGRVRGVLRGLQSARPLRRMREQQEEIVNLQNPPLRQPRPGPPPTYIRRTVVGSIGDFARH
ncbi:uncharacterized protein isoform X22 [Danio rerio]|uniref:Uncharacterized protein isoform X22 n=1 Tax=Danio rerio TaxID=7955 RepID=A0AC58ITK9_DANRE|nr:putative mediator of RNA polymerase II transcription subunit 26 isoform X6 [Danio rerio]|eukprot:XP_009295552.1 putative mediator of RNA polymerase II transcription subunit 26 isoform X6 [Danio rerio]